VGKCQIETLQYYGSAIFPQHGPRARARSYAFNPLLGMRLSVYQFWFPLGIIGPIYTGDGSSVRDELGQRTVARLIIRLCINTGRQTDYPSTRAPAIVRLVRRTIVGNSSRQMIGLFARIY